MSTTEPRCGLDVSLAVMGGKWKPLILYHLRSGPKRFGELKRRVTGISEKVLIQQLRELVAAEVLVRHDHGQVPPRVDYTMTAFGETLVEALMPLCEWGTRHRARVEAMQASPMPFAEPLDEQGPPPPRRNEIPGGEGSSSGSSAP